MGDSRGCGKCCVLCQYFHFVVTVFVLFHCSPTSIDMLMLDVIEGCLGKSNRSGWCSGYHARFTRERSRVQSSHPIFFFQQTEDRFIFSRRLFISVIYTWTKGNDTTHCEYVATSEIISLCNSIVSLSAYARRAFKSHSVLYWESPRPLPSLSLRTWRNNALRTLLQFQKRLDRCHCILDRRFLLIDVCHHRIRRGSSQFRHLPSAQVDHLPKCVI